MLEVIHYVNIVCVSIACFHAKLLSMLIVHVRFWISLKNKKKVPSANILGRLQLTLLKLSGGCYYFPREEDVNSLLQASPLALIRISLMCGWETAPTSNMANPACMTVWEHSTMNRWMDGRRNGQRESNTCVPSFILFVVLVIDAGSTEALFGVRSRSESIWA